MSTGTSSSPGVKVAGGLASWADDRLGIAKPSKTFMRSGSKTFLRSPAIIPREALRMRRLCSVSIPSSWWK